MHSVLDVAGSKDRELRAIGTLNEGALHVQLKDWYRRRGDRVEELVDGFVVDLVRGNLLVEIQTGGFAPLRRKLELLTRQHRVRLVAPARALPTSVAPGALSIQMARRSFEPRRLIAAPLIPSLAASRGGAYSFSMAERYCVGTTMAIDWDEEGDAQVSISRGLIARAFSHFLPFWRRGLLAVATIAISAAIGLVPALLAKKLIDHLTVPNPRFSYIVWVVIGAFAASLIGGLVGVAQAYLSASISQGIMFDLRRQLVERLLGQSVGFFTRSRTGDLMSRINNDVGRIDDVISSTVFGVVRSVITVAMTLAFMLYLDWRLTLVALAGLPLAVIPSRYIGRASYRAYQRTQHKLAEMSAYLQEVLGISGILLVKAFAKEPAERRRFGGLNADLRGLEVRQQMIGNWYGMLMSGLIAAGPAVLWLFGGYRVIHHQATLGTVVTLGTVLTLRLYSSVADLGNLNVNVLGSLALFQRLFQYIDLPAEVADVPGARPLTAVQGAVAFDEVSFAYPGGARPALKQVSFQIEPGQLVALVGPSGAGKTTTSYLVPRFYDPSDGTVRIDGQDLRTATLQSIGQSVGVVFQDTFLWHASIRDNLLYAFPDASERELEDAARAAYLHEFIASLPEGYDTIVGERGHRLSGGEKQRLALARVILKNAPVLILDEATSHLDSRSEQMIQAALRPLFAGRTSLVIAHRLSTILAADVILVFDQGAIVERGDHSSLLARGGLYAELYERQFLVDESERVAAPV
ncbi:MAG: ABC transporter ATP-binding protein [Actinobacteria bacterium]|nr:ABC transporter ATP-binding protein [Actinomycetota bacterium]